MQSDEQLVERLQSGDKSALEELMTRHQSRVLGLAQMHLGDRSEAEDVMLDVFMELYRVRERLDASKNVAGLLSRMTSQRAIDRLRRRGQRALNAPDFASAPEVALQALDIPARAPNPASSAERTEMAQVIREAVSRLPELQRAAVVLHYEQDLTSSQIACDLSASVASVESALYRARRTLYRVLVQHGF